jgi:hypothetical protein
VENRKISQNYWVFGVCPSSGILEIIKHNVSETGSVSFLRWGGRRLLLDPLERTNVNHWTTLVRLSIYLSIYLSTYVSTALVDLGRLFSFLIHTQSVGLFGQWISPSQGRYLHTEQHNLRINTLKTSIPRVGLEPTIPAFERAKTFHALDRAATVTGCQIHYSYLITWDEANSEGDNRKICNTNCDKARTFREIGQKGPSSLAGIEPLFFAHSAVAYWFYHLN